MLDYAQIATEASSMGLTSEELADRIEANRKVGKVMIVGYQKYWLPVESAEEVLAHIITIE